MTMRLCCRVHWGVRNWQDALWLGVCVALVYAALTAPQTVAGPKSLIALGFVSLHKFVVVTAMAMTIFLVRKYR